MQMVLGQSKPEDIYPLYDHDEAPLFNKGNVVMVGDAAHATFPFIGNGAAQAIEDGAVLHALFAHVKDKSQIPAAFTAFDEARRPRALRIVEVSREIGRIYTYDFREAWKEEDDIDSLQAHCRKLAAFTNEADLISQNNYAVSAFQRLIRSF